MNSIAQSINLPDQLLTNWAIVGMANAARGLSAMVGRQIDLLTPSITEVPLNKMADYIGGPETEMVGIYLLTEGDFHGQVILLLSLADAFHLVDLLFNLPEGATTSLGELEQSALAEVGNITASFFLNTIADAGHNDCRPSPPAVIMDMLGAIINIIAASLDAQVNSLVVIEAVFMEASRCVNARFWVVPDARDRS